MLGLGVLGPFKIKVRDIIAMLTKLGMNNT